MLDRFMPKYDVVERHEIAIDAPADVTLAAAGEQKLMHNPLIRTIFAARALVLGANKATPPEPGELLPFVRSLGWRVLAESDNEIVVGAVTKPWEPDVTFRGLDAGEFTSFNEPGYVKIVWSLRADPLGERQSMFRTETRATATDAAARAKFRRYWALASPGIWLIRRASLRPLKFKAEHRARKQANQETVRWPEYHAG
jgi:hypothetical protein